MKKYIYSLIVPAFNEAKTISRVVKKARKHVDEIIVVDDGSTDNTLEKIEDLDITIVINKKNLGQEKSIENGIKRAKGNIIITMDADCEHDPKDIPRFKQMLINDNPDLIQGRRRQIPRKGERKLSKLFRKKFGLVDPLCGYRIFKKKVYQQIGYFYKKNYYGLDFLIETSKRFRTKQILITQRKRRKEARVGDKKYVSDKLKKIISYVKKSASLEPY